MPGTITELLDGQAGLISVSNLIDLRFVIEATDLHALRGRP